MFADKAHWSPHSPVSKVLKIMSCTDVTLLSCCIALNIAYTACKL